MDAKQAELVERVRSSHLDTFTGNLRPGTVTITAADRDALLAALAERDGLRAAVKTIGEWDCLNPPRGDLLSDLPWLRQVVDSALAVAAFDGGGGR